ncbi:hypothetical protein OSB04_011498 [Centaurea solstitialis]|uniref:Uncharacterized protein n=1 Tax=Centaurea solstitialis TaxID=347529 RepID=A0AA38TB93_9ASTR|nr:hypothetical protein OSB04_011498 [Centaurea solstitialis]
MNSSMSGIKAMISSAFASSARWTPLSFSVLDAKFAILELHPKWPLQSSKPTGRSSRHGTSHIIMKEIGYDEPNYYNLFFKKPDKDLCTGLQALSTDDDVMMMCGYIDGHTLIEVYCEKLELHTSRCVSPEHIRTRKGLCKEQGSCSHWLSFK